MTKQELYLSIFQIIGSFHSNAQLNKTIEFDRDLCVNVSRNSDGKISHITMEFIGIRARYLCSILFNGNGDQDTNFDNFAMPKIKLNAKQRSLAFLACMDFLISNKVISANLEYFVDRCVQDHLPRTADIMRHFEIIVCNARMHVDQHQHLLRGGTVAPESGTLTFAF